MNYTKQQILEVVNNQLLHWIKKDEAVKNAVFELVQTKYPTRKEMDDKFEKMLTLFRQELANDREAQEKKWDAQEKKWDAQEKKWDEQKAEDKKAWNDWFIRYEADRAEDKRKWDE
ncbi:MAG: hypothetical protein HY738_01975, partial [Bacteroidia bacterium]|nr:hypothetical protein [Bacteroidia bacterium]